VISKNLNHEVLDLGLVYYKNILSNTQQIIDNIEDLDERYINSPELHNRTVVQQWSPWINDSAGTNEVFCWQKFVPTMEQISEDDAFKDEQRNISIRLHGAIDDALNHYSNALYPFAAKNVKAKEHSSSLLRYDKSGFLPAHQDQGVSTRVLSVLLYLNDDYNGGEITFRQSGVTIKPEAGSLVFFPSNFLYVHEVAPVTKGPRYALPTWFHNVPSHMIRNSTGQE
jgi:Rps23 Pro-64 3,4-dihydroxylase Tpa1-like proline 4-hydroxylase